MIEGHKDDAGKRTYQDFSRSRWSSLCKDSILQESLSEIRLPQDISNSISPNEITDIYLPLSKLLTLYAHARRDLFCATAQFLDTNDQRTPFVIGISGSVASGKSTIALVLKALLPQWQGISSVDLIATDGFLYPNHTLRTMGIMDRKGFPESYDSAALLCFIARVKAGESAISAPVYSHQLYDVIPNETHVINRPDILIIEGLNINESNKLGTDMPLISDFVDFSIFVHASEADLEKWYVSRFMSLRQTAIQDRKSHFQKYVSLSDQEATVMARSIWTNVNLRNLRENVLPNKHRSDLILKKGPSHAIENISIRKL